MHANTHTHTHTQIHTLSAMCASFLIDFRVYVYGRCIQKGSITCILSPLSILRHLPVPDVGGGSSADGAVDRACWCWWRCHGEDAAEAQGWPTACCRPQGNPIASHPADRPRHVFYGSKYNQNSVPSEPNLVYRYPHILPTWARPVVRVPHGSSPTNSISSASHTGFLFFLMSPEWRGEPMTQV